jgi:type IV pilus assembly protein PilM
VSKLFSFIRRSADPIGLDFGSRVIRMVQLLQERAHIAIQASAARVLPPGPYTSGEYEDLRARAVNEMLAEGQFIGRDVVTALNWNDLQVRNLRIPQMPQNEIQSVIQFEAAERFGLDPSKAEVRYVLAGDVRQGTEVKQEVIAFGADRSAIDSHLTMLAKLGLNPVALDAGPCAIFRSFERFLRRDEDANEVNVFLDIGYTASRVVVSRGSNLIFFKSIPVGGICFDELVAEQLDLNPSDATQLRYRWYRQHVAAITGQFDQLSEDDRVSEDLQQALLAALRPALEQLAKEVSLCLRYCSVTFRGMRTQSVTVAGGEACNGDVLRVLSDLTNVPFNIGKAMRNIGAEGEFGGSDRRTGQPEWATAVGLALKPISVGKEVAS